MSYSVSKVADVFTVKEVISSFTGSKVKYYSFNLVTGMRTRSGLQNAPLDMAMSQSDIDWAVKHYVPKAAVAV